jgi:hypothetical protein
VPRLAASVSSTMGQAQSQSNRQDLTGDIAVVLDKDPEGPDNATERVFRSAWERSKDTAKQPMGMARSVPWGYFEQGEAKEEDATAFLHRLLRAKCVSDSAETDSGLLRGAPQCAQFAERELPGVVISAPWDSHPTAATLWDFSSGNWGEMMPHVELARAHPGDHPADDPAEGNGGVEVDGSHSEGYRAGKGGFSPLTTRAGTRLWALAFAAPPMGGAGGAGAGVEVLKASFPMQLMVRVDNGPRKAIVYDALEFKPTAKGVFAADAAAGDPVTPAELARIERILKITKRGRTDMMGIGRPFNAPLEGADDNDEGGGNADRLPLDEPHTKRWEHHGASTLAPLADWVRFKQSRCLRARFPMSAVCGARLVCVDDTGEDTELRPQGDLPPAVGGLRGCSLASLGDRGPDSEDGPANAPEGYSDRARQGTAEWTTEELEPIAILVLELSQRGGEAEGASDLPMFAQTRLWPRSHAQRKRTATPDWTPNQIAGQATRHYIIGDKCEVVELAKALAEASPRMALLLRPDLVSAGSGDEGASAASSTAADAPHAPPRRSGSGEQPCSPPHKKPALSTNVSTNVTGDVGMASRAFNTLAGGIDKLLPEHATTTRSLAAQAAAQVLAQSLSADTESGVTKAAPAFTSEAEVHSFLARAGVEKPERANPCLKAGLLSGCIEVPDAMRLSANPSAFLEVVLLQASCSTCGAPADCTVRAALSQPEYGGNDYEDGNQEGAVQCGTECDGMYITNLCGPKEHRQLTTGKFHNHCTACPDFGQCIGDYREAHCHMCSQHYFQGMMGFRCQCQGGGRSDDESGESDYEHDIADQQEEAMDGTFSMPPADCWNGQLRGLTEEAAGSFLTDALVARARPAINQAKELCKGLYHIIDNQPNTRSSETVNDILDAVWGSKGLPDRFLLMEDEQLRNLTQEQLRSIPGLVPQGITMLGQILNHLPAGALDDDDEEGEGGGRRSRAMASPGDPDY